MSNFDHLRFADDGFVSLHPYIIKGKHSQYETNQLAIGTIQQLPKDLTLMLLKEGSWLLCEGQYFNAIVYPELNEVLEDSFGWYHVPDYKNFSGTFYRTPQPKIEEFKPSSKKCTCPFIDVLRHGCKCGGC